MFLTSGSSHCLFGSHLGSDSVDRRLFPPDLLQLGSLPLTLPDLPAHQAVVEHRYLSLLAPHTHAAAPRIVRIVIPPSSPFVARSNPTLLLRLSASFLNMAIHTPPVFVVEVINVTSGVYVCRSLRGRGGQTARSSSLNALQGAALTLLEGYRLQEPVFRREHPPTYGMRWGPPQGAGDPSGSSAAEFRAAYAAQLQKGAADDDRGVVLGRHLMHVPACYCVAGSRPALCPENDYYNDLLAGPAQPQSILVSPHTTANSIVRDTLARMECLFPPKQLIQDDCGKLIAMVRPGAPFRQA